MSKGFFERLDKVIQNSDIVLEVLDARFPEWTRNEDLERQVVRKGKQLVLVLNKADLVSKRTAEREKEKLGKEFPVIFVSATEKHGSAFLRNLIGKLSKGRECSIGIVGFPNTGKSSLINFLSGRHSARTSSKAGFTRGEQLIKLNEKIRLWDSPGIIPYREHDSFKLVLSGAKNPDQINDIEFAGLKFFEWLKKEHSETLSDWGFDESKDSEELLEDFARKKNRLLKGGLPDTKTAASMLLQAWQRGKLKI